jgi:hypothetical protein
MIRPTPYPFPFGKAQNLEEKIPEILRTSDDRRYS